MRTVTCEEYLDELNRRLRFHPDYRPGMRFVHRPGVVKGFDWEPKGLLHPFAEVSSDVRKEFTIAGRA